MPFSCTKVHALNERQAGRRRWALALAGSIAINEIAIGLFGLPNDEKPEAPPAATLVMLERRPTPRPTVPPTPKPTPPPVVRVPPHATPAPVAQTAAKRAAGVKAPTHGGRPSPERVAKPKLDVYTLLAHTGLGRAKGIAGTGTGVGTGAAAGGGDAGTAAGAGTSGNGSGAVNANKPCGDVTFNIKGAPKYVSGTAYENVYAIVSFPDGHTETAFFPYKWVYPDGERTDPWSNTNLKEHPGDDYEIVAQTPPPGSDISGYEPLIRYILVHTGPDGHTNLGSCPNAGPPPPPPR
ncbi:MAG: hypothetical protein NVSMB64_15180 [Candidatus Velthaea sp.]